MSYSFLDEQLANLKAQYAQQIQQAQQQVQPPQTPDQIAQNQKFQLYQQFLKEPEGIKANNELSIAFNKWCDKRNGVNTIDNAQLLSEVNDLKALVKELQEQNANMTKLI